jgi:hypothetical protein
MWHFENSVTKLTIDIGLNWAVNNTIGIVKWVCNDVTTNTDNIWGPCLLNKSSKQTGKPFQLSPSCGAMELQVTTCGDEKPDNQRVVNRNDGMEEETRSTILFGDYCRHLVQKKRSSK